MCVNPILIRVTSRTFGTSRFAEVPCGKCVECLKRRQNDWKLRIVHESASWAKLYFFTLTYANDSLPCRVDYNDIAFGDSEPLMWGSYNECVEYCSGSDDMVIRSSACKDDVQRFLKRMRTNYCRTVGTDLKMKYFICAEYGPNPKGTKRPHYHGILLTDASYFDLLPYFNSWRDTYGRMEFKQVGFGRDQASKVANYISKYCAKGCFESRKDDINNGFIEKAWYIMSKNIGLTWLEANKSQWLSKVPLSLQMKGDWSYEDVERFFMAGTDEVLPYAKEIDNLIDSFFVRDGQSSYSYKMPRYYRERLLCVQKVFENPVIRLKDGNPIPTMRICESQLQPISSENGDRLYKGSSFPYAYIPEPITYECVICKVRRYVSENFLSVAFAYRLSLRVQNRFQELYLAAKSRNPNKTDSEILLALDCQRENERLVREKMSAQKLSDFYTTNMWKHREFDYEFNCELNYNIFN